MPVPLFWSIVGMLAALLVLIAWLGSRRRRLNPTELRAFGGPLVCASCGYDVQGLPSRICPECGSDLDVVGRLTPQFRRWQAVPPLLRAVTWTLCVFVLGGILTIVAALGFTPQQHEFLDSQRFYIRIWTQEVTVLIDRRVVRTLWPVALADYPREELRRIPPESILLQIDFINYYPVTGPQSRWQFERAAGGGWELRQPPNPPKPATADLMAQLLASVGLSMPQSQAERSREEQIICESLVASFDLTAQEPSYKSLETDASLLEPRHAVVGFGRTRAYYRAIVFMVIPLWVLVWLLGLPFVLRRRGVRQRR